MIKDNQNDKVHPASSAERIAEILAEGVYSYLKGSGFLKEDVDGRQKIQELLEETKGRDVSVEDEEA